MKLKRPLFGPQDPRGPSRGRDVKDFVKRTLHRYGNQKPVGDRFFPKPAAGFDDVYNEKTAEAIQVLQRLERIRPVTGNFGQPTLDALWEYADAYAKAVYRAWTAPKPKPTLPELIEPVQGFASLHPSLREAYSLGRHMGLSDLGTYNPSSRLPSGARSDHAVYPAMAFDLGVEPDTGYANPVGRAFFHAMIGRPEISYVILGDRIASAARGWELRLYSSGGHGNHAHASGWR